jgi:predicted RNA methylase
VHPNRAALEFYATPPEGVRALLSVESFDGSIWEPACGDGAMSRELIAAGYTVVSTDIADRGYGVTGVDFLQETKPRAKHIVTNPPYGRGLADQFIGHALRLTRTTGGSVAMLLDLSSLCHPTRTAKFIRTPPAAIYGLDELVCLLNGRHNEAIARAAHMRYCWAIWKPGHTGRPSFWWVSTKQFRPQ